MAKEFEVVTMVYTNEVYLYCPYCGEREDGFIGRPDGKDEYECESCGETYMVSGNADVEME